MGYHKKAYVYTTSMPRLCNIRPDLIVRSQRDERSTNMGHSDAYIRVFTFYKYIKYHLLNMLKIKCDINQQYLKTVDLNFFQI